MGSRHQSFQPNNIVHLVIHQLKNVFHHNYEYHYHYHYHYSHHYLHHHHHLKPKDLGKVPPHLDAILPHIASISLINVSNLMIHQAWKQLPKSKKKKKKKKKKGGKKKKKKGGKKKKKG